MLSKEKLTQVIKDLPENFSIEELLEKLVFIQRIDHALEQSEQGKIITTSELLKRIEKWQK